MKKNIIISIIVILVAGAVGFFLITKNTQKIDSLRTSEYVQIATPVTEKIIEEEISQIGGVADHKINEIKFIADNTGFVSNSDGRPVEFFKNLFPKNIEKSFIVSMDYSIKLNNNVSQQIRTTWLAGNGDEGVNGWINNKIVYVRIDKTPEGYAGTILGTGL